MYCRNCGEKISERDQYCPSCGQENKQGIEKEERNNSNGIIRVGFSDRISDPAFHKYLKSSNQYSAIFSLALATIAVIGFYIAGERGLDNMENPQALYIGLGIGGMFILIALFQILARKRSKTWDGVVVDKKMKRKTRRHKSEDGVWDEDYVEYKVTIRQDHGKNYEIIDENDDTLYNYYDTGDKIRHHGGLNSYEKYDKTGDSIIFCSACATLCDINDDVCFRCKCPLLK